jgi:hypothetical protein
MFALPLVSDQRTGFLDRAVQHDTIGAQIPNLAMDAGIAVRGWDVRISGRAISRAYTYHRRRRAHRTLRSASGEPNDGAERPSKHIEDGGIAAGLARRCAVVLCFVGPETGAEGCSAQHKRRCMLL